jgi:hypothetical protein
MVKYCQNKLKFHLIVEKDRGNTWKQNQETPLSQSSALLLTLLGQEY